MNHANSPHTSTAVEMVRTGRVDMMRVLAANASAWVDLRLNNALHCSISHRLALG